MIPGTLIFVTPFLNGHGEHRSIGVVATFLPKNARSGCLHKCPEDVTSSRVGANNSKPYGTTCIRHDGRCESAVVLLGFFPAFGASAKCGSLRAVGGVASVVPDLVQQLGIGDYAPLIVHKKA